MQFPALPAPVLYDINLNRSNSDCTTRKTDRSPFVRLSVERSSMRRKVGINEAKHFCDWNGSNDPRNAVIKTRIEPVSKTLSQNLSVDNRA